MASVSLWPLDVPIKKNTEVFGSATSELVAGSSTMGELRALEAGSRSARAIKQQKPKKMMVNIAITDPNIEASGFWSRSLMNHDG
jgi:hypothetical protein